ncbi:MAG: PAS domain S-box protein [Methanoregula sp.]
MADRIRVLCVDDETVLLEMGKEYLEEGGEFSVDTALSARAALDILNKNSYDAIVSDYLMPEMNGIEFLKTVRATDKTTPFIIFTGRSREDIAIEALNNGADFYLQKGGEPTALYLELAHVIRQSVLMKRTLTTLAEQEQRYHDLQNANDLIQSVGPDGHFLFVNKKWLDTLGYQEQDLHNLTLFDIIHDESLKPCMEIFQRVISGENVGIIDAVFKDRTGKKVYVEGIADCKMADGRPLYTRGIFKNVTERKELDAALKESEARYRNVVEDQTEFICRFRPDGTFVFVNDAYCRYFNKKRDEIIGKLYITNIPEEDRAGVAAIIALLTREHPVATTSNRVILEDGRVRWHQWSNRAIFDEDGKITEYQSVGRDITDLKEAEQELLRKNEDLNAAFEQLTTTEEELRHNYELISRNEQALRESEEKYRLLTEITDDVIYMIDVQGTLTHISPRITRYGYTPDEVISRNFTEFIAKEDVTQVLAEFEKTVSTGKSTVTTIRIRDKTGTLHWMEDNGAPVLDSSGSVVAISGILRDVSGRVKAEEALRENEAKFRTIFDNSPYPISINSIPDGKFIEVNSAFLKSSGYEEAEVLGKSPVELGLLSLLDYGKLSGHLLLSGKLENVPMVLRGKGEIAVHVQFSTIPIIINNRSAIMTMTAEITKLKRVEEELLQKNEELRAAYEELAGYQLPEKHGGSDAAGK